MGEPVGGGFLEPDGQSLTERGQAQLFEDGIEVHGWTRALRL